MVEELLIADYALDASTHVVEAAGQVDLFSAPSLKERIWQLIDDEKTRLVVDLTDVTFMDSTGLGVLIGARKRLLPKRGELALVVTREAIDNLFELTGLDGTFTICRSRDAAIEHLQPADGADSS